MKRPELLVASGKLSGRRFDVTENGLRLGRSSSNDVSIPDEELSRNHCLFEIEGESSIRVTDLSSANGTVVNGVTLGADPVVLKPGDVIEVGSCVINVVSDEVVPAPATAVDLGLGQSKNAAETTPVRRRSPLINALWGLVVVVALAAIYIVLTTPSEEAEPALQPLKEEKPKVSEVVYEKIEATLDGVYRYLVTVSADGSIRAVMDDTKENRHPTLQPKQLGEAARDALNEILSYETLSEFEREYAGPEPEPQALNSWRFKVVYTSQVREVSVINTQEPDAFRSLREKFEAFANNELGTHAIRYSREKLVALAEEQIGVGKAKWDDRDVQYGNLFDSVAAYREALFYLETLDPKPDCVKEARQGLDLAKAELDKRYGDQRFVVDRAINLADWETAHRELTVLIEMIPDRKDNRNREASAKLLDVEKRMKGGK